MYIHTIHSSMVVGPNLHVWDFNGGILNRGRYHRSRRVQRKAARSGEKALVKNQKKASCLVKSKHTRDGGMKGQTVLLGQVTGGRRQNSFFSAGFCL